MCAEWLLVPSLKFRIVWRQMRQGPLPGGIDPPSGEPGRRDDETEHRRAGNDPWHPQASSRSATLGDDDDHATEMAPMGIIPQAKKRYTLLRARAGGRG